MNGYRYTDNLKQRLFQNNALKVLFQTLKRILNIKKKNAKKKKVENNLYTPVHPLPSPQFDYC